MSARGMQCKDIADVPVLAFLDGLDGQPATWCWPHGGNDVAFVMPDSTPPKLVLAKMRMLMKRGLVDGCGCGCRGDFELTDLGRAYLLRVERGAP